MANKDQGLRISLTGGLLTISLGVSTLCQAIKGGTVFEDFMGGEDAVITDEDAFARAITAGLGREEENGDTPVHDMLDRVARRAINDGAEGVLIPGVH
ncbi:hypothetical protein [Methylobacterium iners]|uniref:Uncharacterized protein n=1 Tax=Methylobacterium iners TaxID=418707 RepID=A0ABQ4S5R8_9HYPH|nr:hypothetical protein [Methylobacterium iners]GJD97732.1 hypothetical protein OCOJLMKI_4965 [Methylobacterium iners]